MDYKLTMTERALVELELLDTIEQLSYANAVNVQVIAKEIKRILEAIYHV